MLPMKRFDVSSPLGSPANDHLVFETNPATSNNFSNVDEVVDQFLKETRLFETSTSMSQPILNVYEKSRPSFSQASSEFFRPEKAASNLQTLSFPDRASPMLSSQPCLRSTVMQPQPLVQIITHRNPLFDPTMPVWIDIDGEICECNILRQNDMNASNSQTHTQSGEIKIGASVADVLRTIGKPAETQNLDPYKLCDLLQMLNWPKNDNERSTFSGRAISPMP